MHRRDFSLDFARGILIILVVVGHSFFYGDYQNDVHLDNFLYKVIYSFHMPAFMLLSGYLFYNSNKKALKSVILSKIKTIGVPFVTFSFVMWLLMHIKNLLFNDAFSIGLRDLFDYMLTSKVMWYLASLFLNCVLVAILSRVPYGWVGYVVIMIVSLFIPTNHPYVYPAYSFMFPYFLAGYYMMKNKISLFFLVGRKGILSLLVVLSLIGLYFYNRETYIYGTGMYILTNNPLHSIATNIHRFVIGLTMTFLFFTIIGYIKSSGILQENICMNMFVDLGKCSLGIYGFQQILTGIIINLIDHFNIQPFLPSPALLVLINSIFVIFLSYSLTKLCLLNKLSSFLFLGKFNKATT